MNHSLRRVFSFCASLILGSIFLLAALSKIEDLSDFYHVLSGVKIVPHLGAALLTFAVPGLELVLGVCLLTRSMLYESALLAAILLLCFLVFGIYMNLSSDAWTCPCFKIGMPIWFDLSGWWVSFRDLLFLILSFYIAFDISCSSQRGRKYINSDRARNNLRLSNEETKLNESPLPMTFKAGGSANLGQLEDTI